MLLIVISTVVADLQVGSSAAINWGGIIAAAAANSSGGFGTFSNAAGQAFLDRNAQAPGVGVVPVRGADLQLKICAAGTGQESPMPDTPCTIHYEGRFAEEWDKSPKGPTFDSSFERSEPASFAPTGVILGWGFTLVNFMRVGDVFELYIPSELAYGDDGTEDGVIPGGAVLVFTLQLISIDGPAQEYLGVGNAPVGGCDPLPALGVATGAGSGSGGGNSTTLFAVFAVCVIAGGGYFYYKRKKQQEEAGAEGKPVGAMTTTAAGAAPPPKGVAPPPASTALPEGWQEMADPSAGRSYYYNTVSGETTWTTPTQPAGAAAAHV